MDFFLEDFVVFFSTRPYKTLKLRKNLQDDFGMLAVVVFPHQKFLISRLFFYASSTSPWVVMPVKVSTICDLYPGFFWLLTFVLFYRKHYGFEHGFFNPQAIFTLHFFPTFQLICGSDGGWNTPSRIFLYVCCHRVDRSSQRIVLNY